MKVATPHASTRIFFTLLALTATACKPTPPPPFHNAPADAGRTKNPLAGQSDAATAGRAVYEKNCLVCHGAAGQGVANIPALREGPTQAAAEGSIFWYITQGDLKNGMPSWATLPDQQRWQVVTYLKTMKTTSAGNAPTDLPDAGSIAATSSAPRPTPPFTDYRYESPGTTRWIKASDLPAPYQTRSADNGPRVVRRPRQRLAQGPRRLHRQPLRRRPARSAPHPHRTQWRLLPR